MKKIWEYFDELHEVVYVADIATYELVYVNKLGLSLFGYDSVDALQGKKCYEVFQDLSCPCSFCTNSCLKAGSFYEWKFTNPITKRIYFLKDTLIEDGGRLLRMEIAIDATLDNEYQCEQQAIMQNEILVNECLKKMHATTNPEESISIMLKFLGEMLQSDRSYIFESDGSQYIKNTFEWCKDGVEAERDLLQCISVNDIKRWYDIFKRNESVIIENTEDLRESCPDEYRWLEPQDITSLVVSPLSYDGNIIGFFGVDNPPPEKIRHIALMLDVLGHFVVSVLKRRDLINKLCDMSYHDNLTGALNRNAMDENISCFKYISRLGVVFCDVSGLKVINDTQGHSEGDRLLVAVYIYLMNAFSDCKVYRMGGDEFLVLCPDLAEHEFYGRVAKLKETIQSDGVCNLAIGYVWSNAPDKNIRKMIEQADTLMYEDKTAFYNRLRFKS